jgi:hypothetical protein
MLTVLLLGLSEAAAGAVGFLELTPATLPSELSSLVEGEGFPIRRIFYEGAR